MDHVTFLESRVFSRPGYADKAIYSHIIEYEDVVLHNHEFIEFVYVFEGSCSHVLNDVQKTICIGDAFMLIPSDKHKYVRSGTPFLHRDILLKIGYFKSVCDFFSPTLFDQIVSGELKLQFTLSIEQMSQIEKFVPFLTLDADDEKHRLAVNALASYLINLVIENNLGESYKYPMWLTHLISMLNTHENLSASLSQIIEHFAYSKEYMRRSFKKHIGMTMTDYFNKQKMAHAHALLTTTSYSIERICEVIGITNISYFYQLFKKTYGVTPHSLRKQ